MASPSASSVLALLIALVCLSGRALAQTPGTVNCLVAPCSTPECKMKCAAYGPQTQCVDNYIGGCNCDCIPKKCIPKNKLCPADAKKNPCCAGLICDFTNSCIANPFTKCGTICTPPADAASNCKRLSATCNPAKKTPCCKGTTCITKSGKSTCQPCAGYQKSCSSSTPCCPYLSCVRNKKTGKRTCEATALLG